MPTRIGKYEVHSEMGHGAFGRVFRAYDPVTRRTVAIKVLITDNDPDVLARFFLEVQATATLKHKNIVTIYDFNETPPYIVMEFVEGESLQQIITHHASLSLMEKVRILFQTAEGLACAHKNGIVHRDIKPANIMVLPNSDVKIMDFGIARVTEQTDARRTRQGDVIGTILYLSPERIRGAQGDACSDIFSLGVVGCELITGRHPFQGEHLPAVADKIAREEVPPLHQLVPECPESLDLVIQRAIAKEPGDRYQSMEEILFDLKPVLLDLAHQQATSMMREVPGLIESGQFVEAQDRVRSVLELDPTNREARSVHESLQKDQRRRQVRTKVDTLLQEGEAQLAQRQFNKAIQSLESAWRLDTSDTHINDLLLQAKAALETSGQASRLILEARREMLAGNLDVAYENAANALKADPQHHDAKALCEKLRPQIEERDKRLRVERGIHRAEELLARTDFHGARAVLAEVEPEADPDVVRDLRLRIEAEQAEEGQAAREQRVQQGVAAARQQMHANQLAEAGRTLQALLAEFPDATSATKLLAAIGEQIESQQRADAITKLTQQALVLLQSQSLLEARRVLEAGLRTYPSDAALQRLLDRALDLQREQERSQATWQATPTQTAKEADRASGTSIDVAKSSATGIGFKAMTVMTVAYQTVLSVSCLASWLPPDYLVAPIWLLFLPLCLIPGILWLAHGFIEVQHSVPGRAKGWDHSPLQTSAVHDERGNEPSRNEGIPVSDSQATMQRDRIDATVVFPTRELVLEPSAGVSKATHLVSTELTAVFSAHGQQTSTGMPAPVGRTAASYAGLTIANCFDPAFIGRKVDVKSFPFDIGRNASGFQLSFDQSISAKHAEIEFQDGWFVIRDLNSANGTFVEGRRVPSGTWERIFFGTRIVIGTNTELLFVSNEPSDIPDLTDTVIDGRYTLTEKVHSTAKSVVYRADDRRFNQPVAVKILSPHLVCHSGYREQFVRDAHIARRLHHPYICPILDFGETQLGIAGDTRSLYVCTEYLNGGSLSERLDRKERFELARTGSWLETICSALEYLRRNHVVHGGIKPSSIIFDSEDQPHLTDFALSTKAGTAALRVVIGSPAYLAPEQWTGTEPLPATDQYSLAVTFYRVITGSLPYEGQEHPQVRKANLRRSPIPAHLMAEQNRYLPIPCKLSGVLERAMSPLPENRFESAQEFARAFRLALAYAEDPPMRNETKVTALIAMPPRSSIFVSYSHCDIRWLNKLKTMLKPLERAGGLALWDDSRIKPGEKWKEEIRAAIAGAKVAVLLVSPDFLASDFVTKNELPPILEASEKEGLKVLWIPLSDCLYSATAISHYQAAWNPSQPLAKLRGASRDKALVTIAKAVEEALDSL